MAAVTLTVNQTGIDDLSLALASLVRNQNKITAQAMTGGVIKAKAAIQTRILPSIQGGPSRWTQRGLIALYAQPDDLTAMVGFNYDQPGQGTSPYTKKRNMNKLFDSGQSQFKGGGVPSGRYMEINAKGGKRQPKSSDLQLRRAGILRSNQLLVTNSNLDDLDSQGNLPGRVYQQMLSRVKGLQTEGSTQSSNKKPRRNRDYFVMRERNTVATQTGNLSGRSIRKIGQKAGLSETSINQLLGSQLGKPLFIARRVGQGGRGFEPMWWVSENVTYSKKFPIQGVAIQEFNRVFPERFRKALENEIKGKRYK